MATSVPEGGLSVRGRYYRDEFKIRWWCEGGNCQWNPSCLTLLLYVEDGGACLGAVKQLVEQIAVRGELVEPCAAALRQAQGERTM